MLLLAPILGVVLLLSLPGVRKYRGWPTARDKAAISMGVAMAMAGVLHFVKPGPFVSIVPDFVPAKLFVVYFTGVLEVLGGLALAVLPRYRKWISWGLIAFLVAVFPANIVLALNHGQIGEISMSATRAWVRLPFQLVFIAWTWWAGSSAPQTGAKEN